MCCLGGRFGCVEVVDLGSKGGGSEVMLRFGSVVVLVMEGVWKWSQGTK
jgi:hypothetical protein